MMKKWSQRFYLFLIVLFLYAPIGTLMVLYSIFLERS